MSGMSDRSFGISLVLMGTVLWSTAGLFMRMLDLDIWTILGWRSLFGSIALWLVVIWQKRRRGEGGTIPFGFPGLAAVALAVISMASYISALKLTTVANVLAIYATLPFVCAGLAFLWMGVRVERRVLLASGIAFLGVLVVAAFATRPEDMLGNAMAFSMTVSFGMLVILAQRYRNLGMAKVNALGSACCALICIPLMSSEIPSVFDLCILAGFGCTSTALAYLLFLTGGRYIPAGEAGLIALLDVVLGPLWVWLAFAEEPGLPTVVGSALILSAVCWYLWASLRSPRLIVPG